MLESLSHCISKLKKYDKNNLKKNPCGEHERLFSRVGKSQVFISSKQLQQNLQLG